MRVGQKNSLVYQWAKKGTRPRQPKDQRYENAYLFGANIWQYLRQTYLSNCVFESYNAILDACQDAWCKLLAEVGCISSIAARDWATMGQ